MALNMGHLWKATSTGSALCSPYIAAPFSPVHWEWTLPANIQMLNIFRSPEGTVFLGSTFQTLSFFSWRNECAFPNKNEEYAKYKQLKNTGVIFRNQGHSVQEMMVLPIVYG